LPVQKEVSYTNNCPHDKKKLYHGRVAGTVLQLSALLPSLLSPFPEATEFLLSACFSYDFGYRPVWLLLKFSFGLEI